MGFGGAAERRVASSYLLRARHANGREQTFRIDEPRRLIGTQGDVVANGPGVQPQHAELLFRDGMVGVRDLGTDSGTWCEGCRIDRRVLRPGRSFRVGGTRFELLDVEATQAQQAPSATIDDLETQLLDVRGGLGSARVAQLPTRPPARPIVDASIVTPVRPATPPPAPARQMAPAPRSGELAVSQPPAARVVIAEADPANQQWLQQAVGMPSWVATTAAEVTAHLEHHPRLVVVVGYQLSGSSCTALIDTLVSPGLVERVSVLAVDGVARNPADLYYRLLPGMPVADLQKVVAAAARPKKNTADEPTSGTRAWHDKQIFDICAAVSARPDPASAARAIEDGVRRLVSVAHVTCLFHDAHSGTLWTESDEPIEGSAATGIAGFVARTGAPVHAPAAGSDPRYDSTLDNPGGDGTEAVVAVPIASRGEVHAVVVAVRQSVQGFFEPKACARLGHLATELGPIFSRLSAAVNAEEALAQINKPGGMQIFRAEAVEAYLERKDEGEVIRIAPHWTRTMYWALLAMLVVGMLGAAIGSISDYSEGPAVIRQEGRAEVAAAGMGALATIDVQPGQRVTKGQVLARLRDVTERAEYNAIRNDFRAQLRNRLLDPNDNVAAAAVRTLKRQLDAAQATLEQRVIRSPHAGIVTDIAVDPGQHLKVGDSVMAVVDDNAPGLELIAFLPGGDRPLIEPGMELRLELSGFDYAYQDVVVESITEGIVGPGEAKRILGPQLADTLPIDGTGVVMVRASLPTTTFVSDGTTYPYHDGMGGTAEIRTRDETILEMIIPALKELSL